MLEILLSLLRVVIHSNLITVQGPASPLRTLVTCHVAFRTPEDASNEMNGRHGDKLTDSRAGAEARKDLIDLQAFFRRV